jgi:hypothetical protein
LTKASAALGLSPVMNPVRRSTKGSASSCVVVVTQRQAKLTSISSGSMKTMA